MGRAPLPPIKITQGWLRASHRAEDAKLTGEMSCVERVANLAKHGAAACLHDRLEIVSHLMAESVIGNQQKPAMILVPLNASTTALDLCVAYPEGNPTRPSAHARQRGLCW